ncbi:sulfatase [Kocuria tytonicola]|uniref:LTA synthase family protein n=1 Tax=Kocuria tytonicola TaxID=2055946 RepID=A0A3L9L0K7_9MICC|nr:LTA synthase family protein [Kocuria tytonicola]RLY91668.1 LTA synthase family protein [Kocuria tytonicola]RLZ02868.1 sulfatase [Kocuria tytonicola]
MSGRTARVIRRAAPVLARSTGYLLLWAGLVLLAAASVIRHYWGPISVGQMKLNLVSVQADGGGGSIVWVAITAIGVLPVLITGALAAGLHVWRRRSPAWRLSRRSRAAARSASALAVAAVVISGSATFASAVGLKQYVKAAKSSSDIGDYYADPAVTDSSGTRNLVVVYLESGEQTLADDQLFEKNAFAPLEDVTTQAEGWRSVPDFQQYEGGGWTMAGLVSTQCGIPLKGSGPGGGGNDIGGGMGEYLGGVTCLGDVLQRHGYTNVFLGGANSSFAGKDVFLRTHGYTEDKGLQDWRAAGEPPENFRGDWGLSDERLMAHARDEVDRLHAESGRTGRPFNLSVLTLDTHEPVHVYDSCDVDTQNEVTSVFACSMTQVAGFVQHMKDRGYLQDTSVVVMGDHLKHMSAGDAFHEQLDDNPDRTIFNRIWIPEETEQTPVRPGANQLDMYPTLLEAAGLPPRDGRAGLGVSVRSPQLPRDAAQALDPAAYSELLASLSPRFYARAWNQPEPTG